MIAVVGFRLAVRKETIDYTGDPVTFIVPAKTLSDVVKLFSGDEEATVSIGVGKRHILFEVENYTVVSRLLDGDFVDSIDRTSLIITDKIKSPLRCVFDNNQIRISSTTSLGTASDKVAASIQGNAVEIGFNNRFLMEALRVCDTDEVLVLLYGSVAALLIVERVGDRFLFLILQVRLKAE